MATVTTTPAYQGDGKGESRGASRLLRRAPFGRGLGVSPRYNLYPLLRGLPFLARKGAAAQMGRTRVERVFQQPARGQRLLVKRLLAAHEEVDK